MLCYLGRVLQRRRSGRRQQGCRKIGLRCVPRMQGSCSLVVLLELTFLSGWVAVRIEMQGLQTDDNTERSEVLPWYAPHLTRPKSQKHGGQPDWNFKLMCGSLSRLCLQEGTVFDLREADSGYDRLSDVQQIASPSIVLERARRPDAYSQWLGGGLSGDNLLRE